MPWISDEEPNVKRDKELNMPRAATTPLKVVEHILRLWTRHRLKHRVEPGRYERSLEKGSRSGACTGDSSQAVRGAPDRRKQEELMRQCETKVVGYFAYRSRWRIICTNGAACVISGSARAMRQNLEEMDPERAYKATVRKTRFGEVVRGLKLGAAYAFDRGAYRRFYPLAVKIGLPVEPADFDNPERPGGRFFTVRLIPSGCGARTSFSGRERDGSASDAVPREEVG